MLVMYIYLATSVKTLLQAFTPLFCVMKCLQQSQCTYDLVPSQQLFVILFEKLKRRTLEVETDACHNCGSLVKGLCERVVSIGYG